METVQVVEVGPRDGLQNEAVVLSIEERIRLIAMLIEAGVRRIEAVSFAHPARVPQMAGAEAVMAALPERPDVSYIGLVMNWKGWERAAETAVDEVNLPLFATDTFNRENQGASTAETLAQLVEVVVAAGERALPVTATISAVWGCPYEGEVPLQRVVELAERVAAAGIAELALADTIGVADPWSVTERVAAVANAVGAALPLRVHFHDTRNTGLANAHAAIEAGVRVVDASVGGIGGCPFAPAATGNIATDDLVFMLHRAGIATGIDLRAVMSVSGWLEGALGKQVPAMLPRAGIWPPEY